MTKEIEKLRNLTSHSPPPHLLLYNIYVLIFIGLLFAICFRRSCYYGCHGYCCCFYINVFELCCNQSLNMCRMVMETSTMEDSPLLNRDLPIIFAMVTHIAHNLIQGHEVLQYLPATYGYHLQNYILRNLNLLMMIPLKLYLISKWIISVLLLKTHFICSTVHGTFSNWVDIQSKNFLTHKHCFKKKKIYWTSSQFEDAPLTLEQTK